MLSDDLPINKDNSEQTKSFWSSEDEDNQAGTSELTDIKLNVINGGAMVLDFMSHGRHHNLQLSENPKNLSKIYMKFLGVSADWHKKVEEKLKVIEFQFYLLILVLNCLDDNFFKKISSLYSL